MAGGKRAGAGHKSEFTTQQKQALFAKAAETWSVDAPEDVPKAYQVLREMAGIDRKCRVMAKMKWTPHARRLFVEGEEEFEASDGSLVWVYTLRPDLAALKFIMEKATGKAAQQPQAQVDTVINLIHGVPRPGRKP